MRHTIRRCLLALFASFVLVVAVGTTASCNAADEFLSGSGEGIDCYPSFNSFKRAMKRAGKELPSTHQWHHIVNQNPANKSKFGERLHCTDNLIALPKKIHSEVSAHYSSKQAWSRPKTVRDVVSARSWDEQYKYGLKLLNDYGIEP